MKKGQSLPLNTVVIAAIAIIVLIVVIAIFMRGIIPPSEAMQKCATFKGSCATSCAQGTTEFTSENTDCVQKDMKCCIPITN